MELNNKSKDPGLFFFARCSMTEPKADQAEKQFHKGVIQGKLKAFLAILGPGLISGAADDDPSGIGTFSQTGAQFGYT